MNLKLNKTDWILIAVINIVSILINSIQYYQQDNRLLEYFVDFPVSVFLTITVILIFIHWLIPEFVVKKKHYFLFTILGCVILCITGIIDYVSGFWSAGNDWAEFPSTFNLIIKSFFRTADDVGFTFGILLAKKYYEGQALLIKSEKQQKENELKLLRSQLDPHFLFNNLNTLDSLIDSDAKKAKEYINRLSLIYRYLIKTKDAEVMELAEEIELAENYFFLIKTRFGNDYEFEIIENTTTQEKFIPTGALQTLIENVVKHNKSDGKKPIKTTITINEGWLIIANTKSTLKNNQESFGTGLENLKARYKLLSDKNIQINNFDKKFEIFIPIITLSA